jgi:hypothetical protein
MNNSKAKEYFTVILARKSSLNVSDLYIVVALVERISWHALKKSAAAWHSK